MDEAAALLEEARLGDENGVWEAREHWRLVSCRWLEGKGDTEDILEAAQVFVAAVESVVPPQALRSMYPFNEPGEPVLLHAGPLSVMLEDRSSDPTVTTEAAGEGRIHFEFLPTPRVSWEVVVKAADPDLLRAFHRSTRERLVLPHFGGSGFAVTPVADDVAAMRDMDSLGGMRFYDILLSSERLGTFDGLSDVRFHLVNCPLGRGTGFVLQELGYGSSSGQNAKFPRFWPMPHRLTLEEDGWRIDIDARQDFAETWEKARKTGSFVFTHVGRIRRLDDSPFSFERARNLLTALHWFLSFVVGRRVGVALPVGLDESGNPTCTEWGSPVVDSGVSPFQWYHESISIDLPALFSGFYGAWRDRFWKDTLPQVICAYTFAKDGRNQGTLTLAQTALETLAWAVLGIRKAQLSRSAFERLTAAERIRMLLNWAGVPTEVPVNQSLLAASVQSLEDHKDGPQVMVWARNKIVHPARSSDRRSMMREIALESNYLALWYLELTLLRIFNHQGEYVNWLRGTRGGYLTKFIEHVPWATRTTRLHPPQTLNSAPNRQSHPS